MALSAGFSGQECISLHRVMVHDRGGVRKIDELLDIAEVEYNRERDQVIGARVVVSGRSCRGQRSFLQQIAAMRHELVIFRGSERVWEGPILEVRWFRDRVELVAHDVIEYIDATPLSKDWPNSDDGGQVYMTERIRDILTYELQTPYSADVGSAGVPNIITIPRWENFGTAPWDLATWGPPINVLPHLDVRASTGPQGILTRSSTLAFEMMAGEHLRNLAEGGLDFTAVGRRILIWDSAMSIGRTRNLTDADFYGELTVIASGTEHASVAHISAQREEPDPDDPTPPPPSVGNAGAPDPFYGVWTRIASLASEEGADTPSQMALNSQARRQLVGRNPVPTEIVIPQGGGLRLSHDLRINELVPGVIMPVRATLNLRPVSQDQRLDKVTVKEVPGVETVQVSLSPAGVLEAV
jgi:hypothetical protein